MWIWMFNRKLFTVPYLPRKCLPLHPLQVLLRTRAQLEPAVTALLLELLPLFLRDHIRMKTFCLVYSFLRTSASTHMSGRPFINLGRHSIPPPLAGTKRTLHARLNQTSYLHEKERKQRENVLPSATGLTIKTNHGFFSALAGRGRAALTSAGLGCSEPTAEADERIFAGGTVYVQA